MAKPPAGSDKRSGRTKGWRNRTGRDGNAQQAEPEGQSTSGSDVTQALSVPVVGIGASAGGIEALGRFFDAVTEECGCAFVVVLHLDPSHESEMARVLSAHTKLPVAQVQDGMRLAPDHVYVIAPDSDLVVRSGGLHVSKPSKPRGQHHPVDVLFASMAEEMHERAIAVVLSGTGSNGTEGLRQIRAEGGMGLVQTPETAKFDGMPRSAIAAGMADHILPPEEMPAAVLRYVRHGYISALSDMEPASPSRTNIDKVLELLRIRTGRDFGSYKRSTQRRRIYRRMGLKNIGSLDEYIDDLSANPDEMQALMADLMISVTGFFRDAQAWQALAQKVIAPLVAGRRTGSAIRIWVPACSTGEEAYSIAMLVTELADAAGKRFDVKVFATDAQEDNLLKARDGTYPAAAVAGLSQERLRRFFEQADSSWQVTKELRDMIVFARQNLLIDPPFSRLDLVSCRNFLIYLDPEAQQRVIALCHFALREGGHLLLGNAETTGRHDDLFETVSKKWRIYRRIGPTRHDLIDYPKGREITEQGGRNETRRPIGERTVPVTELARRALLERYAPASVLIDRKGRVLYFHGTTRDYLEHPPGEPTRDLLTMARDGLSPKLRAAMREVFNGKDSVSVEALIRQGGTTRAVAVTVMSVPGSQDGGALLVSFAPASTESTVTETAAPAAGGEASSGERALQEELTTTRAELRSTIEHLETANEELKASNEEAISMNEELQSTNEELETSKEELQSFNEELNTVNHQLQHKIAELERATNDLNNLLAGSETATLFLDDKFRIKWFSPATRQLFDLVSSDIGRPIAHFARKFLDENLLPDAETVLKKLTPIEREVLGDSGRWFLRRMLPYRTRDNHIAGVVITFVDITERKHAAEMEAARIHAEAIVETIQQPLVILDPELRVTSANRSFYELFKVEPDETEGRLFHDLGSQEWNNPELRAALSGTLAKAGGFKGFRVDYDFEKLGRRTMLLHARKMSREPDAGLILLAIEDVTAREHAEQQLRAQEQARSLREMFDFLPGAIYTTDAAGRITSYNPAAAELWGRKPQLGVEEWCGSWRMFRSDGTTLPHGECPLAIALKEGRALRGAEAVAERPDGVRVPFLAYPTPLRDESGTIVGAVNMLVDITERKQAEEVAERLASIVESSDDAILSIDIDGNVTSWNSGAERLFGYKPEEIVATSTLSMVPPDRRAEEADLLGRIRRGEHIHHYETVRQRKDGSEVWVSLTVSPLADAAGKVIGASTIARDMSERRRADEHRKVLIGELNHRVKNTLAIVQSIAFQTLTHATSVDKAREAFGSRLINLAKAHDILTQTNWTGADLEQIVSDAVKPHSGGLNRFRIEGPHIELSPSAALAFSMALHELATNAAKYGALSAPSGLVSIVWEIEGQGDGRRVTLSWEESGGPKVVQPKRKGFGSRLIERALAAELGGEVRVSFEPSGLVCTISAILPEGQSVLGETDERAEYRPGADSRGRNSRRNAS